MKSRRATPPGHLMLRLEDAEGLRIREAAAQKRRPINDFLRELVYRGMLSESTDQQLAKLQVRVDEIVKSAEEKLSALGFKPAYVRSLFTVEELLMEVVGARSQEVLAAAQQRAAARLAKDSGE